MSEKLVTLMAPCYNAERFIERFLNSVLAQSYKKIQFILVNDGSTDSSAEVVQNIMRNTDKIRLIEQTNAGVSVARNTGISAAKGEYIAFLDADDLWEPVYLEELALLIHDFPDAAIYGIGAGSMTNNIKHQPKYILPEGYRGVVTNIWNFTIKLLLGMCKMLKTEL